MRAFSKDPYPLGWFSALNSNNSPDAHDDFLSVKKELEDYIKQNTDGKIFRSKIKWYDEGSVTPNIFTAWSN